MLALRGAINSGLVKAMMANPGTINNAPLLANLSASSALVNRNQSTVPSAGVADSGKISIIEFMKFTKSN